MNGIAYLNELDLILDELNVKHTDVILTGSEILAQLGIRENHDLDIILRPNVLANLSKTNKFPCRYRWRINLSPNIELYQNHLDFIGISDKQLFTNHWFSNYDGYQIIPLEINYLMKLALTRDKDKKDLEMILQYDPLIEEKSSVYKQPPYKIRWMKFLNLMSVKLERFW